MDLLLFLLKGTKVNSASESNIRMGDKTSNAFFNFCFVHFFSVISNDLVGNSVALAVTLSRCIVSNVPNVITNINSANVIPKWVVRGELRRHSVALGLTLVYYNMLQRSQWPNLKFAPLPHGQILLASHRG